MNLDPLGQRIAVVVLVWAGAMGALGVWFVRVLQQ